MLRQLARDNATYPDHLIEIPQSQWPPRQKSMQPLRLLRSRQFTMQIYSIPQGGVVRLSVNRTDVDERTLQWVGEISWDELQRLKREAGYGDYEAVEIYPRDCDVVNVATMRHLWVLPKPMPFSWRNGKADFMLGDAAGESK